jgi:hypothetical protein
MMKNLLILGATLTLLLGGATSTSKVNHGEALIQWLRSKEGGFFHSKLQVRQFEESSQYGLIATGEIKKGELLVQVPPDFFLTAASAQFQVGDRVDRMFYDNEEEMEEAGQEGGKGRTGRIVKVHSDGALDVLFDNGSIDTELRREDFAYQDAHTNCGLVKRLIQEMRLGSDSYFAPFVNYLHDQPCGQLPSAWSKLGLELLFQILGMNPNGDEQSLPPDDFKYRSIETDWHGRCYGSKDPLEEKAHTMVTQRSWDDFMIPITDLISHRNGPWCNADITLADMEALQEGGSAKLRAIRDVQAGEEIYTSYNLCLMCVGRKAILYGTPEILRDYGFVEQYPQRWSFPEALIAFDLDKDGLTWIKDKERNKFSERGYRFLREQLERLIKLGETDLASPDPAIPKSEFDTIARYHRALVVAITHAVKSLEVANDARKAKGKKGWDSANYNVCSSSDGEGACSVS